VRPTVEALFAACLPELSGRARVVVALRFACGLEARSVARALLVPDDALDDEVRRPGRAGTKLETVLTVVYLLFSEGFTRPSRWNTEALRLGRALFALFPAEPSIASLLALMTLHEARALARFDERGAVIPLERQDPARFDGAAIERGAAMILHAIHLGPLDAYGLQAAIALEHVSPGPRRWARIEELYAELEVLAPSPVVTLNRAAAIARCRGEAAALACLEPVADRLEGYVPFAVLTAVLLRALGHADEAHAAYGRAIAWSRDETERVHLRAERSALER